MSVIRKISMLRQPPKAVLTLLLPLTLKAGTGFPNLSRSLTKLPKPRFYFGSTSFPNLFV